MSKKEIFLGKLYKHEEPLPSLYGYGIRKGGLPAKKILSVLAQSHVGVLFKRTCILYIHLPALSHPHVGRPGAADPGLGRSRSFPNFEEPQLKVVVLGAEIPDKYSYRRYGRNSRL
jgi:hypothetical protein